jgi:oligoribonuclease NrnB/cAMP/cGMP phosphodiesterase (DHH superfamily)
MKSSTSKAFGSLSSLREYLPPKDVQVVVHHFPCTDGYASAYTFDRYFKENDVESTTYVPWAHTMTTHAVEKYIRPQIEGKNVVFVDVAPNPEAFPRSVIEGLLRDWPAKCVVLDHHVGVYNAMVGTHNYQDLMDHYYFDVSRSGATIAWDYCYSDQPVPRLLQLVEDRDIFGGKFEETTAWNTAWTQSVPFDFSEYDKYVNNEALLENVISEGRVLEKYLKLNIENNFMPKAVEKNLTLNGTTYRVLVMNTNHHISDIGAAFATQCDFAILWFYNHKKGCIKVSLRSQGNNDVSEIARLFGGNGHKNAAGFNIAYPDIIDHLPSHISQNSPSERRYWRYTKPLLVAFGLVAGTAGAKYCYNTYYRE